jgi:hypothetical protein
MSPQPYRAFPLKFPRPHLPLWPLRPATHMLMRKGWSAGISSPIPLTTQITLILIALNLRQKGMLVAHMRVRSRNARHMRVRSRNAPRLAPTSPSFRRYSRPSTSTLTQFSKAKLLGLETPNHPLPPQASTFRSSWRTPTSRGGNFLPRAYLLKIEMDKGGSANVSVQCGSEGSCGVVGFCIDGRTFAAGCSTCGGPACACFWCRTRALFLYSPRRPCVRSPTRNGSLRTRS